MPTLRLTQSTAGPDRYRVHVTFEGDGRPQPPATAEFAFSFTAQDREDLRWYLEDYLEFAAYPAPKIAARVEERIAEIGAQLFRDVFESSETARRLWARLQDELNDTRVEVTADVQSATAIPWELLRDPLTGTPLALEARAFVRAQTDTTRIPKIPRPPVVARRKRAAGETIRILLVICRPGKSDDVPFRSVASRLIKGLGGSARETFDLDVLRPPTFEQLAKVLRAARAAGKPYHVVHFDGYGTYTEVSPEAGQSGGLADLLRGLRPLVLSGSRTGAHGYLLFENPAIPENLQLVDGPALGALLTETDVPVLILNACRSAHADAPAEPENKADGEGGGSATSGDVQTQVRAFGSLAQEVVNAGVAGVVAMRYNVYVVTAAQFVADLYGALVQGQTLGEAVTLGRKQLHDQPQREIAYEPRPLQDWPVPIVYEAAPIALFPRSAKPAALAITLKAGAAASAQGALDPNLPPQPDAGFFGRDETLLALDRAFDTQSIVLLHAYAGSGKTATSAEFARWYALTGGIEGPVLFTSFEQYKPLARVLDDFRQVFGDMLENAGVHWQALDDEQRRDVTLQVLGQVPALWIWDNVEPIAGFPAGAESAWSAAEQRELADFLRAARETEAKFLLTSRRDERSWLGELPARIAVSPMPMQERVQLARALAEKHGRRLTEVEDWRPLLGFTQGNPLTITVLVGQALRDGLQTRAQIEGFVSRLRAGESAFTDEASEGRSRSLGASLSYGFEHALSEAERKQLALLHCFQGFVYVGVLQVMGRSSAAWCLPEVRGLTREDGIALLDRAAEVGLLTALGRGYYSIHPALPWFFKSLFEQYYADSPSAGSGNTGSQAGDEMRADRAYVKAFGEWGSFIRTAYGAGNRGAIHLLRAEETNLIHACRLAVAHSWWDDVLKTIRSLQMLYDETGRFAEWVRLFKGIAPKFIDPNTDSPLPGQEEHWDEVTGMRMILASHAKEWEVAERLSNRLIEFNRRGAASILSVPSERWKDSDHEPIDALATSLSNFALLMYQLHRPECIPAGEEALMLFERIGRRTEAARCALHLGHVYSELPSLRDLDRAAHWYRRALEFYEERDNLGRSKALHEIGQVYYKRYQGALMRGESTEHLWRYLNYAIDFAGQALELTPQYAVASLSLRHHLLGNIYDDAGYLEKALSHYRKAIHYWETSGDISGAAKGCREIARALVRAGRLPDAMEYARESERKLHVFGGRAAADIERAQQLIAAIEQQMQSQGD